MESKNILPIVAGLTLALGACDSGKAQISEEGLSAHTITAVERLDNKKGVGDRQPRENEQAQCPSKRFLFCVPEGKECQYLQCVADAMAVETQMEARKLLEDLYQQLFNANPSCSEAKINYPNS
ncbi:hypothetical protein A2335_03285 [Candidatus Peregrinibacteria bacterium RIFOXYB2_FULL_32_7]|nr:MAG: hypothetical protein A2335_03285 [Candidatus Peregrinibacteria bacterium RIFOXYB2_FULL_32_7]